MAAFLKVANERRRMCDSYEKCIKGCPLGKMLNGTICSSWILGNPVLAEDAIMKWAAEHPVVTNGMKFREVFGQTYEVLFEADAFALQWLEREYKGGQDEQN